MSKTLVACFSASGVTARAAQILSEHLRADLYEIKPLIPYTPADLDWRDKTSRSTLEMEDPASRPALLDPAPAAEGYDTVLLGFPIWWYRAPTIINSYLEACDLAKKTVVLFATSGGSGFGKTADGLRASLSPGAVLKEGKVFRGADADAIRAWADAL